MRDKADEVERKLFQNLQADMQALGSRLKTDPESDPLIWPVQNCLAATRRPVRDHPDFKDYICEDHLPAHAAHTSCHNASRGSALFVAQTGKNEKPADTPDPPTCQ